MRLSETLGAVMGKVLDASVLACLVRGDLAVQAWLDTARALTTPLCIPSLALAEIDAVRGGRTGTAAALADLKGHPSVLVAELGAVEARAVDELLARARVFDPTAGHVVFLARRRGWPVLSADPARLQHVDPDVAIETP